MTYDSIYYYKGIGEFKRFIQRIDDKTLHIAAALSTFREVRCLNKQIKQTTIAALTDEPKLILALWQALRNGMAPESKFRLPYKKEEREEELIENLAENYGIDKHKAKAKIVTGHFKNDKTRQEFNYALEVVIAPRTDIGSDYAGKIEIIGNINSSPSIDGGEKYFDGIYNWRDKKYKMITSTSIRGILQECGFNESEYVSDAKKKVPSVIYINLNTPCPDWLGSAGKTHLDIIPYAADIAKTISSLAYKMPSYHGLGYSWSRESYSDNQQQKITAKSYLEDFLRVRFDALQADPSLKQKDPLTQSGVWYRLRPGMIMGGYIPPKNWGKTREYITGEIDKVCQELFDNVEREDLGIVAKARAMMMYDGNTYPVDLDSFEELGRKGVFILIIEKEGIANILEEAAIDSGVALVHTAGRFTKYVKFLIENSQVPVATLTDYDAYGIAIARGTISGTPRVGIDMDIIEWLQKNGFPDLTMEELEEEYISDIETDIEYLKSHRIELDSIVARVGPKVLWNYIKQKIEQLQKNQGFDYSNIFSKPSPEQLYPQPFADFVIKLNQYIEKIEEGYWQTKEKGLRWSKELISVKECEREILSILSHMVAKDETIRNIIVPKINKLLNQLPDLSELE